MAENQREKRRCTACEAAKRMYPARRKMLACCGQRLFPTEVITKSDPTPFGP